MILGLYKEVEIPFGGKASFWRVTKIELEVGNPVQLKATCEINCYMDYNSANAEEPTSAKCRFLNTKTQEIFNQYFVGVYDPIEIQDSYYHFFKGEDAFFEDAIIIDTDIPESLQYLGENPNIIIPQNLQS